MYVYSIFISLYHSVPASTVSISPNTSDPVYQGTVLVFSCTATLDNAVDIDFAVNITWTSDHEPDSLNGTCVTATDTSGSGLELSRTVECRPVNTTDSATYTCTASIAPTASDSDYVLASISNTDTVDITVNGELAQELVFIMSNDLSFLLQS